MHDPLTLAWEIKYPWGKYNDTLKTKMRKAFISVWHVDPEKDGTDDSCGWFSPRLSGNHSLFAKNNYQLLVPPEQAVYYAFLLVRRMVFELNSTLTLKEIGELLSISYNPHHNLRPPVCDNLRRVDIEMWLMTITRTLGSLYRPFWKHPRFHFWHYRIRIHPLQEFKRWAFTRCCVCGKRFKFGESGVTTRWNSTGPLWFRSENLAHWHCEGAVEKVGKQ